MNRLKLAAVLTSCILFGSHAFAQKYVPPPPSRSFDNTGTTINPPQPSRPGVTIEPPPVPQIKFGNGARVEVYNDQFVFHGSDGRPPFRQRRPLPDLARHPYGCKWVRSHLDHSPYSREWIDLCKVYLERCMNLR